MRALKLTGACATLATLVLVALPQVASASPVHPATVAAAAHDATRALPADQYHCYSIPGEFCAYTTGGADNTPCLKATGSTPVWPSGCINNEDAVDDQFNTGDVRIHYLTDYYGAYACINHGHYWLYLSTSSYNFSYPGEGYQPYGAKAGQYQKIWDNAASDNYASTCS